MIKESLYRLRFMNQDDIYEIYARSVSESDMFGFLEVGEFVFGENTSLVVDTSEERLKMEFHGVKRTYIPMHAVIRIDEVDKQGAAKVFDKAALHNKISPFPGINKRND